MKKPFSIVLALLLSSTALAQPADAIFYEITGKGLAKPSYLFGTFHAICPGDVLPMDKIAPYINDTEQLIMEVDLDDAAEMQKMTAGVVMTGGKTLKDFYTPAEFAKVDEMVNAALGLTAEQLKMIKPSMLSIMIVTSPKLLGCATVPVDMTLVQTATAGKKQVIGLETVASQVELIDKQPVEKQAKGLYKMALDPQKAVADLKALMAVYKVEESEKLYAVSAGQMKDDKEFLNPLLDQRSIAWAPRLDKFITEKPSFIAVGAGHLSGKNGVVSLMKARGYKLKAIRL